MLKRDRVWTFEKIFQKHRVGNVHFRRNSRCGGLVKVLLPLAISLNALNAKAADDTSVAMETLKLYVDSNFQHADWRLLKMNTRNSLRINVVCLSGSCEQNFSDLKKYLPPVRFSVGMTSTYDSHASINLVFLSSSPSQQNNDFYLSRNFAKQPGEHVVLDVSKECSSFYIKDDTEIKSIVAISINSNPPKRRDVACILFQLMRSSGMHFNQSFDELWDASNGGLSVSENLGFEKAMTLFSRLLAIHFLRQTKSGMLKEEFNKVVSSLTTNELLGR